MPVDELGDLLRRPENGQVSEVTALLPRVGIDEADEVDVVLGMLEEFATDQLADLAGPDDHRVLDVRRLPASECPGSRPRCGDRNEGEEPERRQLCLVGSRQTDEPRGRVEEPHGHGDEVEDADDLVRG